MIDFNKMWKTLNKRRKHIRDIKEVNFSDINLNEFIIIDVRSKREFTENHLNGSINIPLPEIKKNIEKYVKNKNKKLLICCQSGVRSKKAIEILEEMGYVKAYNLKKGLENV